MERRDQFFTPFNLGDEYLVSEQNGSHSACSGGVIRYGLCMLPFDSLVEKESMIISGHDMISDECKEVGGIPSQKMEGALKHSELFNW